MGSFGGLIQSYPGNVEMQTQIFCLEQYNSSGFERETIHLGGSCRRFQCICTQLQFISWHFENLRTHKD